MTKTRVEVVTSVQRRRSWTTVEKEPLVAAIEIEFAAGARMRITGAVDPATVTAALAALADEIGRGVHIQCQRDS
jgi:glycine/D-amino acid oxidase-like deaminating enzyme